MPYESISSMAHFSASLFCSGEGGGVTVAPVPARFHEGRRWAPLGIALDDATVRVRGLRGDPRKLQCFRIEPDGVDADVYECHGVVRRHFIEK